jgi:SHS2 domain-containing protein
MPPFEVLEHTADIGFRAWGGSQADLFENSACALLSIAAGELAAAGTETVPVQLSAADPESLLVDWLSEILYLFDADRLAPARFQVDAITTTSLRARISGEPRDPARHPWRLIVKAITYHQIEVAQRNGRWEAQVFLDI